MPEPSSNPVNNPVTNSVTDPISQSVTTPVTTTVTTTTTTPVAIPVTAPSVPVVSTPETTPVIPPVILSEIPPVIPPVGSPVTVPVIRFHKVTQISESHCGPAVIQMLLSNIGIDITQEAITEAAGATKTIIRNGMRIDEMDRAISVLHLPAKLWYKHHATLNDMRVLLDAFKCPVGVEWQGLFSEDEDDIDDSTGHYSVVTRVDDEKQSLIIADPYKDFTDQDRIINIGIFLKRWWDTNWIRDETARKRYKVRDDQVVFVVTQPDVVFPPTLSMMPGSDYTSTIFVGKSQ